MYQDIGRVGPVRWPPARVLLAALAALMLIIAGCGGDDDGGGTAGGGGGESTSANIAEAQKILDEGEKRPTQISQTKPVGKPIPKGKKIAYISCGVEACAVQGPILEEGAAMLGWTVTTVNTDGSPEEVNNALSAAIRDGADALILQAAVKDQIAKPLADAEEAGVPFVTCCSTDPPETYLANTGTPEQGATVGRLHAAKFIVDSGGTANALLVDLPAFPILSEVGKTFQETLDELCPDCQHDKIDIPLTALGKDVPDRIVSYLRSHPDVNYAFLVEGAVASGVKPALMAAGLADKVKISTQGGNEAIYQEIAQGEPWLATTPAQLYGYDYNELDALARHFAGVEVDPAPRPEYWLMTSDQVPEPPPAVIPIVEDYKAQWAEIWGVD